MVGCGFEKWAVTNRGFFVDYLDLHYIEVPILRRPKGHGDHKCACGKTYYEKKNLVRHQRVNCVLNTVPSRRHQKQK